MADFANPPRGSGVPLYPRSQAAPRSTLRQSPPRVIVCSDIRLLREGITFAVAQDRPMNVIGAVQPEDAAATVAAQSPDVVLLDAGVAGGRGMPRLLKKFSPDLRVVVFALADAEPDIVGWAEAGVDGYIGRDGTVDDLTAAVEGALRGEAFCPPRLAGLLFARVARLSEVAASDAGTGALTPREQEIMALVDHGLPNKEIARRLGIGHATVKNHVHRILEKMQVRGRGEAAARRRHVGQSSPPPTSAIARR
jgi:two-component system nitrate/nitrite response regulator NarL